MEYEAGRVKWWILQQKFIKTAIFMKRCDINVYPDQNR